MSHEACQPAKLVLEFRSGCRVAVGKVEAANQDPLHCRLNIAALTVILLPREMVPCFHGRLPTRQNGNPVPTALPAPYRPVTGGSKRGLWKLLLRGLQFLKTDRVWLGFCQPAQQNWQATVYTPLTLKVAILIGLANQWLEGLAAKLYGALAGIFDFRSCPPDFTPPSLDMPPPAVPLVGDVVFETALPPLMAGPGNADRVVAGGTSEPPPLAPPL